MAIRVRPRQQDLFGNASHTWRHFSIVSNLYEWDGGRLLRWHREKAGTVEHVFAEVKGDSIYDTVIVFDGITFE